MPLMQQNIATQTEALEIAMKLEASPVSKTKVGMNQIQSQLENMAIQLQDIKMGKDIHEYVWCTRCRTKGNHKDQCLKFYEYLQDDAPNPFSQGILPWCRIYQTRGIDTRNVYTSKSLYRIQRISFSLYVGQLVMKRRIV